ncbi:hypothetical protein Ga0074812_1487 [Parafrankia irregularis]|uniref:Uncharacterized protein n=1 Tax=Parafrankia irregularis TaxID=795642 RepID=A0A0S4QZ49_9ACTN|nr:hypothetical protein [Parafrankia irregularis]CUU60807.1 hypothetical protein Ga0074812_1487 [Parafrankia irregularis]
MHDDQTGPPRRWWTRISSLTVLAAVATYLVVTDGFVVPLTALLVELGRGILVAWVEKRRNRAKRAHIPAPRRPVHSPPTQRVGGEHIEEVTVTITIRSASRNR